MAISITKEPEGIYPVYNNSFIEFSSDLANNYKAEIYISPVGSYTFVVYPDSNGVYVFDLMEIMKTFFNENGFNDNNFFTDLYYKSIEGLFYIKVVNIKIYSDVSSETFSKSYQFFKGVKQIGETIYSNESQLLTFSNDGINNYLTYFEGFPFSFDLQKVLIDNEVTVKSINSGNVSIPMKANDTNSFRINIDKGGGENWTTDNFLPLFSGVNRLEIYEDGIFKSNLFLTKKKKCSGVYLKWFNRNGGFNYFLFNQFFNENINGQDNDFVLKDEFENIENQTGFLNSIGKTTTRSFIIKSKYNSEEFEVLKDIFISPSVQLYTSRKAYEIGRFIDVVVDGSISHNNKIFNNEIVLTVKFTKMNTAKL